MSLLFLCLVRSVMAWFDMRCLSSSRSDPCLGASAAERIWLCGGNRQLTDCAHSCQVSLTGLSAALPSPFSSLKHNMVTGAVQIRGYMAALNPLPFLCFTHPCKQTCYMLCDLVSQDQWSCLFLSWVLKTTKRWKYHLVRKLVWGHPLECAPAGKGQRWSTSVTLYVRLEVGSILRAKISCTGAKFWSEVKIEPMYSKGTWWEWRLSATKAEEPLSSVLAKKNPHWPFSQITLYLTFSQFLCGCWGANQIPHIRHNISIGEIIVLFIAT